MKTNILKETPSGSGSENETEEITFSGGLTTNRLEAFSDGVFAIAITILVLTIAVPATGEVQNAPQLQTKLAELWPKLLSYLVSFVVIGIYWVAHSATFHYIERTNRALFWLNLLYLMCVSFIPFPTALLGNFYHYQLPVIIYAGTQVVTGTLFQVMVSYAWSTGLIPRKLSQEFKRQAMLRNLTGPVLYLVSIVCSFISLEISLVLFLVIPIIYILPGKIDRDWRRLNPMKSDENK